MPPDSAAIDPYAGMVPAHAPPGASGAGAAAAPAWHPPPGVPVNMVPVIDVGGHQGAAMGTPGSEFMPSPTGASGGAPVPLDAGSSSKSSAGDAPADSEFDPYAGLVAAGMSGGSAPTAKGETPSAARSAAHSAPTELRNQPWWQSIWDAVGPGSAFAELPKEIVHGATFGMDEVLGALPGALARHFIDQEPLGQAFENEAREFSAGRRAFETNHPILSEGANLAGTAATLPVTEGLFAPARGAVALTRGQRLLNAARNVAAASGLGGVGGFGETEGSIPQRVEGAEQGAVLGVTLAGGIPAAARAAGAVGRPFTQAGAERAAGNILLEATGGRVPSAEVAPIPNMPIDIGQSFNEPGAAALVRRHNAMPDEQTAAMGQRTQQNVALRSAVTDIQPGVRTRLAEPMTPAEASADVVNGVRGAHDVISAEEGRLWQSPLLAKPVDLPAISKRVEHSISGMPQRDQLLIDKTPELKSALADLQGLQAGATLADVNKARSGLLEEARTNPDRSVRRVAGALAASVLNGIETNPALRSDPAIWNAYTRARDFTARKWDVLGHEPFMRMLKTNRYGRSDVDAGTAAAHLFNFGKGTERIPGGVSQITRMLDDVRRQWGALAASGIRGFDAGTAFAARAELSQGARNFIFNSMLGSASTSVRDLGGNPNVAPNAIAKWIDANRPWITKSGLLTNDQVSILDAVHRATIIAGRTENLAAGKGSPTFERLVGKRHEDVFLTPILRRLMGGAVGAATGYLTEGPLGALAGGVLGRDAPDLLARLYAAPREKVLGIVRDVIRDPEAARDMMLKATPGNASRFSPRTKNMIRAALASLPPSEAARHLTGDPATVAHTGAIH